MNRIQVSIDRVPALLFLVLLAWIGRIHEAAFAQNLCDGGAICPGGCTASLTQTFTTNDIGPQPPGHPSLNGPFGGTNIPKFNSSLGTLSAVKVKFYATPVARRYQQENQANFACPALPAGCQVRLAANSVVMTASGAASTAIFEDSPGAGLFGRKNADIVPLPAFDGTLDYAVGGSGDNNCTPVGVDQNVENLCTLPDGADIRSGSGYTVCFPDGPLKTLDLCVTSGLAAYQAPGGGGSVNPLLGVTSADASQIDDNGLGCPRTAFTRRIRLVIKAEITYVYCATNLCPVANPDDAIVCRNQPAACPGSVDIAILANDCDDDQGCPNQHGKLDCSSVVVTTNPAHGTFQLVGCNGLMSLADCPQTGNCLGCVLRYTPTAGYVGTDTLCYTVKDTEGAVSAPASVSIRVAPPPNAVDDPGFQTCVGNPITINVLANDTGAAAVASAPGTACTGTSSCGDPSPAPRPFPATTATTIVCSSLAIVTPPAHGQVLIGQACTGLLGSCNGGSNCLKYTPAAGYCGTDTFVYKVIDSAGCCDTATVTITIFAPPVAVNDAVSTCEDASCEPDNCVTIGVLNNDVICPTPATGCASCPGPSSPLNCASLTITVPPAHGTFTIGACNGTANDGCPGACVRYCPAPGFSGVDTFKYTIADSRTNPPGNLQSPAFPCASNEATVTITIKCAPIAADDVLPIDFNNPLAQVCVSVLDNDSACPGASFPPNAVSILPDGPECPGEPAHNFGSVTLNGNQVCFTPTTFPFPAGGIYIHYKVINSNGCCDDACIRVSSECFERNRRTCASLLLYPEFDNRQGIVTLISVTDGCCIESAGSAKVEFRFIGKDDCHETNQTFTLTPCDTLTFYTGAVNAGGPGRRGYAYVYAKNDTPSPNNPTGTPIVYNHLIGQELILDGFQALNYSMNAVAFRGLGAFHGPATDGLPNDDDGDGIRDLNGPSSQLPEYEEAPDKILIPRFIAQDTPGARGGIALYRSEMILVALSGGLHFTTTIDVLGYNDNEEEFSNSYTFFCWDKPLLRDFAPATLQSYLLGTNQDPEEIVGNESRESGWLILDGAVANSAGETIVGPAIYAVLVERFGNYSAADLPFELCSQDNGDLLPTDVLGDGPVPVNNDNQ